jgi:hypothetical protein
MKKFRVVLIILFLILLVSSKSFSSIFYDDFNDRKIDPAKWQVPFTTNGFIVDEAINPGYLTVYGGIGLGSAIGKLSVKEEFLVDLTKPLDIGSKGGTGSHLEMIQKYSV